MPSRQLPGHGSPDSARVHRGCLASWRSPPWSCCWGGRGDGGMMIDQIRTGRLPWRMVFLLWLAVWAVLQVLTERRSLLHGLAQRSGISRRDIAADVLGVVTASVIPATICT